uniref:Granulysin n=1 Tax=Equus caballus TaxID=9796 RepID=A0A5F5PEN0_HORSE
STRSEKGVGIIHLEYCTSHQRDFSASAPQVEAPRRTRLTFSGLNPESYDLATAHLSDGEQFCQGLTQEDLQGDLLTERERQGIACWSCRKILQKLEDLVGEQPNEATINEAASRVCRNLGLLRGACKKIMRTCLRLISRDILAGKKPQEVCVDIKLCKHKAGLI